MPEKTYRVYPYRWVILGVFMLINLTIQMLWICFAPITGTAAKFYGVTDLQIGFLAMLFMIIYVPLSIPDFVGHRHVRLPQSGGGRGADAGGVWPAARGVGRQLHAGW